MTSAARPIQAHNVPKYLDEKIRVRKLHPNAVFPYRENDSDVGLDVTLVGRAENRAEDDAYQVNYFNTGIALQPPPGHYFEIVARSSLHKHGYMLATGTSIIDPGYTGELMIPLYKFRETEDIELPFRAVQLILRPVTYAHMQSVLSLDTTDRGAGGFGSTGYAPPYDQRQQEYHYSSGSGGSSSSRSGSSTRTSTMF